mgnify:CR=1 FL=1|tara:strand:+ start:12618 stop:13100 length:483 start_codon:yes stop_codon:yes gene_type:complete
MMDESYSGLDAEFYDELLEVELSDYPFWKELVQQTSGVSLEVGCGTGRILIPLLQEGFVVDGMDRSQKMLGLLDKKADAHGLSVNASIQSMESMNLGKTYALIFIPGFSMQMVEDRSAFEYALARFNRHLEPRGNLAISIFSLGRNWLTMGLVNGDCGKR